MTADPRVEALARAMCAAAGNDPNVKVFPAVGYNLERVQGRADYQKLPPDYVVVPAWELWVGDAEAALAFLDAEAKSAAAKIAEIFGDEPLLLDTVLVEQDLAKSEVIGTHGYEVRALNSIKA